MNDFAVLTYYLQILTLSVPGYAPCGISYCLLYGVLLFLLYLA